MIQHDLNSAEILALTGQAVGMPIDLSSHAVGYGGEPVVLATGDRFIDDAAARAQLAEHAHLVDMEGYAVAAAATAMSVPVVCVKEVSDSAGEGNDSGCGSTTTSGDFPPSTWSSAAKVSLSSPAVGR